MTTEAFVTRQVKRAAAALLQKRRHVDAASDQLAVAINALIEVRGHGSQVTLAKALKVTPSYLSDMRSGARAITDKVAAGLAGL